LLQVLKALTIGIVRTLSLCGHEFVYDSSLNPRRIITKPSEPASFGSIDNDEGDLIISVGDILGDVDPHRCVVIGASLCV
jgi:dual specificity protein kinase YAK1